MSKEKPNGSKLLRRLRAKSGTSVVNDLYNNSFPVSIWFWTWSQRRIIAPLLYVRTNRSLPTMQMQAVAFLPSFCHQFLLWSIFLILSSLLKTFPPNRKDLSVHTWFRSALRCVQTPSTLSPASETCFPCPFPWRTWCLLLEAAPADGPDREFSSDPRNFSTELPDVPIICPVLVSSTSCLTVFPVVPQLSSMTWVVVVVIPVVLCTCLNKDKKNTCTIRGLSCF